MPEPEKTSTIRKIVLAIAGIVIVALIVFIFARSNRSEPFELDRQGLIEFFEEKIDEIVPGEGWRATKVRFVDEKGIYVEYTNEEGRNQAFLMLVNPVRGDRIDYEIIGVFNVTAEGKLELVSGIDSFAGDKQEVYSRDASTGEWGLVP